MKSTKPAIAQTIVCTKHGGRMDLTSAPGNGTTFIVHLPLQHPRILDGLLGQLGEALRGECARRKGQVARTERLGQRNVQRRFDVVGPGDETQVTMTMDYEMKYGPLGWLMNAVMLRPILGKLFASVLVGLDHHLVTGELVGEFATSGLVNIVGGCCGTTPPHASCDRR